MEYYERGVNMRCESVLVLFAVLTAFSSGIVLAEDAQNVTETASTANVTNATIINATNVSVTQEAISRFTQLSKATLTKAEVLGKNIAGGYRDVTKAADTNVVFSRGPGTTTPSVKVAITKVNMVGDKWVEITNQAVGPWDFNGWRLVSAGNATFIFPEFTLQMGASVKVHEGNGPGSDSDLYTNNTAPLWIDNEIALQNAEGSTISRYDLTAAPQQTNWVNSFKSLIQY